MQVRATWLCLRCPLRQPERRELFSAPRRSFYLCAAERTARPGRDSAWVRPLGRGCPARPRPRPLPAGLKGEAAAAAAPLLRPPLRPLSQPAGLAAGGCRHRRRRARAVEGSGTGGPTAAVGTTHVSSRWGQCWGASRCRVERGRGLRPLPRHRHPAWLPWEQKEAALPLGAGCGSGVGRLR